MSSDRTPLPAAAGLSRAANVPPPPPRRAYQDREPASAKIPTSRSRPETSRRDVGTSAAQKAAGATQPAVGMRPVTLSLPASLVARVKDRARLERTTQPDILMDALTSAVDRLDQLLAAASTPPSTDGLFVRRPAQQASVDPTATLSLRMLPANLATIDGLVTKHNAPSRSALCAVALRDYLGTYSEGA